MLGRGIWLLLAIAAAIAIPYFMSREAATKHQFANRFRNVGSSPVPSASPIPPVGNGTGIQRLPTPFTRLPNMAQTPAPYMPPHAHYDLPPGATATPWMPVDGSQTMLPGAGHGYVTGTNGYPTTVTPYSIHGHAAQNFEQLFQFNLTPDWVVQTWPRVSSQVSDTALTGLRVPIVSGTSVQDLAGSMTYYFDAEQQLQKIAFLGTTGDPARLVQLATQQLGLEPAAAANGSCFTKQQDGVISDMLRIKHASVTRPNQPHRRYQVAMELNRPESALGLSAVNQNLIDEERKFLDLARQRASQGGAIEEPMPQRAN